MELNILPDAYEDWSDYRAAVSEYVVKHSDAGASCLVVGAGACNDLDIVLLLKHFSSITLADIDMDAMRRGLIKQSPDLSRIVLQKADIIGIDETSYRAFSFELEKMARNGERDLTEAFLKAGHQLISNRTPDPFYENARFDSVVCIGVHSQLLSVIPRIARVFSKAGLVDAERVCSFISDMNASIMPLVNRLLLDISNGNVIFGLENERVGIEGGIEGACQAMVDLRKRKDISITDAQTLLWPFVPVNRHFYRMILMNVNKI